MTHKIVAKNKKARFDYHVLETFEAGLVLTGTEIKSVRAGMLNLKDGYAKVEGSELWLMNVHISPYEKGSYYNHDPLRPRKMLMNRYEIRRLVAKIREKGLTLVPLSLYIKNGKYAKIELALAKGKTHQDKRQTVAKRDASREMARAVRRDDR